MKRELKLSDRYALTNILPREGSITQMRIIKDIQERLIPSQKEIVDFDIKPVGNGMLGWNEAGTKKVFKIEFTELEESEIINALRKADENKKITTDLLNIAKLFNVG